MIVRRLFDLRLVAMSQSPQTGQVYFNIMSCYKNRSLVAFRSQSPQTGQVYFNNWSRDKCFRNYIGLNPLKRVKFISMASYMTLVFGCGLTVSIPSNGSSLFQSRDCKRDTAVQSYVSIPSNGSSLFQ